MSTITPHPQQQHNPPDPTSPGRPAEARLTVDGLRRWFGELTGLLTSLVVHAAILLLLALIAPGVAPRSVELVLDTQFQLSEPDQLIPIALPAPSLGVLPEDSALQLDQPLPALLPDALEAPSPWAASADSVPSATIQELMALPTREKLTRPLAAAGGGFEGRRQEARARLVAERGGSPESEAAVEMGLQWLALHQNTNGGWRFDLQGGECGGRCGNPGTVGSTTGATALALLAFLGAGYTHHQGPYRETVQKGLYYLTNRMLDTSHGGDFQEGTMYAQGLSAIALSEAYAMTRDAALRPFAQKAIDFICFAQHPRGGWRYFPGQPGDTTVTGWQLMALKSARLAGLEAPSPVIELVKRYLDGVQSAEGALYGYISTERSAAATAVGLLCRMYLGWKQNDERLGRGVEFLLAQGPSDTDMYYNYYATQVLHHHQGSQWPRWNAKARDYLVRQQAREGHERGSWFFHDRHGDLAGRLYNTAMCIMILEVYYRHMPLYGRESVTDEF